MTLIRFLVLLLIVAVPSTVQAQQVVREYSTTIRIDVDAQGQVLDTGVPTHVPDVLAGAVRKTVSKWRFKPGQWQGHAVSIRTWIHARVEVVKRPNKRYGVRVVYHGNGPRIFMSAPGRPPLLALRQTLGWHDQVDFFVAFQVDADGSLSQIRAVNNGKGHEARLMNRVRQAVKRWHASPMLVNGKPAISHIRFHLVFSADIHRHHQQNRNEPTGENSPPDFPVAVDSPLQAPIGADSAI